MGAVVGAAFAGDASPLRATFVLGYNHLRLPYVLPTQSVIIALALRSIDECTYLSHVLVKRSDAVKHDFERLIRKSIFQGESIAGENVA